MVAFVVVWAAGSGDEGAAHVLMASAAIGGVWCDLLRCVFR